MGDAVTSRETTDRSSLQDGRLLAHATNLSQFAQETFQPLSWQNTKKDQQSGFLDTSMNALYGGDHPILAQAKVFEMPATQAVEPMPPVSDTITKASNASPFVLNIQITNVPEVSPALSPETWLNHVNRVFRVGAEGVRPTEKWLATPNGVNDSLIRLGPILDTAFNYYASHRPEQIASDARGVLNNAGEALDKTFSFPQPPKDRANTSGAVMPLFFFDDHLKEPMHPEAVRQLGLEKMSQQELGLLGINRFMSEAGEMNMPEVPEHLRHLDLKGISDELVRAVEAKGRTVTFGEAGSEAAARLQSAGAEAMTMSPECTEILVRPDAPRAALLEEFLHGTQAKLGIIDRYELPAMAEVHVKEFMLRHAKLLGLDANDAILIRALRDREIRKLERWGYKKVAE